MNGTALNSLTELLFFRINGNSVGGSLPETTLPKLKQFDISYNSFRGRLPSFPDTLWYLHAHYNQLSGDLPAFSNEVSNIYLNNNLGLTGTLRLNSPTEVSLSSTSISRIFIADPSKLDWYLNFIYSANYCALPSTVLSSQVGNLLDLCDLSGVIQYTDCNAAYDLALQMGMSFTNATKIGTVKNQLL